MDKIKRKKIIIATPNSGGPITYSELLNKKLPEAGFEVKLVNFASVERLPKIVRHFAYFFKVWREGRGADIIYAQDPVSTGLPAFFAAKLRGARFIQKIVGDYAWEQGCERANVSDLLDDFVRKYEEYPLFVRMLKKIETYVTNGAEKVIVPSEYMKGIVSRWGVNEQKITVIYNAFNKPDISETKEELARKFGFMYPTIISCGRLVPWKGFPILIEAMQKVKQIFPTARLLIVDDGPDRKKLEQMVSDLKLKENISFLGKIPQRGLYERIKASDLFVLVSSYEGFSHLILETLALGTPIVTTPVGGNVEVIKDGKNGIFVPFGDISRTGDVIVELLKNRALAVELSKNGLKSVELFTENIMLEKLSATLS